MIPARIRYYCVLLLLFCNACTLSSDQDREGSNENPPSPGFDLANSDPAAVELADSIMVALGGRESWDNTRYITWRISGEHEYAWDKRSGNVRIESIRDSATYLFQPDGEGGRVWIGEEEIVEPDSLSALLRDARSRWRNASFLLVMPFRLKEDGITLRYLGEERTDSARYNLLQITVSEGNEAPPGDYLAYVDLADNLIKMCAALAEDNMDTGDLLVRWEGYARHDNILLPTPQGGSVQVHDRLPEEVFGEF